MSEEKPIQHDFAVGPNEPVDQMVESAPTIFVDGGVGIGLAEGVVKLNLFQDRLTASPTDPTQKPVTRVVVSRLIMTQSTAIRIADWLRNSVVVSPSQDVTKSAEAENGSE